MTSKERVLCAINHKQPDRVPLDLGGAACSMVDAAYFKTKEFLGITGDIEPYRKGTNVSYYDERILDRLSIDIRRVFAKQSEAYPKRHEDGTFSNEWGLIQRDTGMYVEIVKNPLEDAEIEDLVDYQWPEVTEILDVTGMKETARKLSEDNQYAISLRMPCNGIFEIACWLRGMENFMVDTIADPEFAHELVDKILAKQMEIYGMLLDEVGEYVDIVESGDDYGSQKSLLMSPESYREFIFPARKKLNQMIKEKAPKAKIFLHSCGAISGIIEDLIECGVDILNPVQTAAHDMDPKMLKERFGGRMCFHGAVDTQRAMLGTTTRVEEEVSSLIETLGKDGGFILSSCNHIQADIPTTNVVHMFEYAKDYKGK
jgi:Uroporphyrinogen-III decarboxylase